MSGTGVTSDTATIWREIAHYLNRQMVNRVLALEVEFTNGGSFADRSLHVVCGTSIMIDLELATTEQILEELGRRPIKFVHVCTIYKGNTPDDGYIAYSPSLHEDDAVWMLRRAQELLEQEEEPPREKPVR